MYWLKWYQGLFGDKVGGAGLKRELIKKFEESCGVTDMFILSIVVILHVCAYVKTHPTVHFKYTLIYYLWNIPQSSSSKGTSYVAQRKECSCQSRGHGFNPWVISSLLEKEMATHSSILAWRIPWTEEPGGLQPMGLQRADITEWQDTHKL